MVYFGDYRHWQPPRSGKMPRSHPLVENVESQCGRTVTIETNLNNDVLGKCNLQNQSPLFKLPAELRSIIFYHACLPYDHEEDKFKEDDFYYRPEHHARHISSTSLLLTCRRAWLEANHLPLQLGDHSFWFRDEGRRPKYLDHIKMNEEERLENFLKSLTVNGSQNLKHIEIYAQMVWLEEYSGSKCVQLLNTVGVCPEVLTITVRSSDWWWWEHDQALRLDDRWLSKILDWPAPPRLRGIRLRLEIVENHGGVLKGDKLAQLRAIEMEMRSKFAAVNRVDNFGTPTTLTLEDPEGASAAENWSGMAHKPGPHGRAPVSMPAVFRITTLVWKVNSKEEKSDTHTQGAEEGQLTNAQSQELPALNIDPSCPQVGMLELSTTGKQTGWAFEQEWSKCGSLLKFAGDLYDG